jgi:hypothetical protein
VRRRSPRGPDRAALRSGAGPARFFVVPPGRGLQRAPDVHASDLRVWFPRRVRDYPAADKNLSSILDYITNIRVRLDGTNVLDLDDPEMFRNPILYVWEPGYWTIQASEAENLRTYLLKGGFIIFDDFEGDHWDNLVAQMHRALPDHDFVKIDERHPIFHSFYNINKIDVPHPSMNVVPGYYAMYEKNDPTRRMIALANHNSDIAEYWEWSAEGLYNPDPTSNAYRLGVNYYVYAMTH